MRLSRLCLPLTNGFLFMELMLAVALSVLSISLAGVAMARIAEHACHIMTAIEALAEHRQGDAWQQDQMRFDRTIIYEPIVMYRASGCLEKVSGCQWKIVNIIERVNRKTVLVVPDIIDCL